MTSYGRSSEVSYFYAFNALQYNLGLWLLSLTVIFSLE